MYPDTQEAKVSLRTLKDGISMKGYVSINGVRKRQIYSCTIALLTHASDLLMRQSKTKKALGACDEEFLAQLQIVQKIVVKVRKVHQVKSTRFSSKFVKHVHFGHLPITDGDKGRDIPAQIKQCVEFHHRLRSTKRRPRKHRQTQIDRGPIHCIDGMIEIDTNYRYVLKKNQHTKDRIALRVNETT